jgi:hypothetical protein
MMYQTLHHIPIVQGVLSRKIDKSLQDRLFIDEPMRLHSQLLQHGVTHLVFHKKLEDRDHPLEVDEFRDAFPALYEDDDQVVFQVVERATTGDEKIPEAAMLTSQVLLD